MSQSKKNKVVVKTKKTTEKNIQPTSSRIGNVAQAVPTSNEMLFGKANFTYMLGGLALIGLGMLLMSGGHMPSADVWDESIIYSFRRTVLAPVVILAGLAVEVYAIFIKK